MTSNFRPIEVIEEMILRKNPEMHPVLIASLAAAIAAWEREGAMSYEDEFYVITIEPRPNRKYSVQITRRG